MDPFTIFNTLSTNAPLFASTTGIAITQISSFATSSVLDIFGLSPFVFLYQNIASMIGYGMIITICLIGASAYGKFFNT